MEENEYSKHQTGVHVYSVQSTVYCSIAEEFKSDDEVNISTESKDAEATEEVYIFLENRTNFDCELLGS